jgi:hypothetical protein
MMKFSGKTMRRQAGCGLLAGLAATAIAVPDGIRGA